MGLSREAATAFFDDFVAAFSHFDGPLIARRYSAPYVALQADGSVQCFAEHAAIGQYFQSVVDAYHQQGVRSCRYCDLEIVPLGTQGALATVTWELLDENGEIHTAWRESYNLAHTAGDQEPATGWRIFASVDHVG